MAHRFAKVSEEEIEEAFSYPSDLVSTKITIPLRVGEERWIYTYYIILYGKSLCSDWFFLGQDFAVRTVSMETG